MMIEDNYYINIAVAGRHWGRVELGCEKEIVAQDKARVLQKRFPEAEVMLIKVTCRGEEIIF